MNQFILETHNLNFSHDRKAGGIENLELKVPQGSIYGFLGPNGAGKSTTIRLILDLLKKHSGKVFLFGTDFNSKTRPEILGKIGALIESPSLYEHLNAIENLQLTASYRNVSFDRINEVLEIVKLIEAGNKKVKEYSLGMKQRLGLAMAILSSPELLILDEPTNGLDPKGIIDMRVLIKELNQKYGTTIFISSHFLSEIERTCTHVGIIRNGKMLYQDTVKALKATSGKNIKIELEVDKPKEALSILKKMKEESATLNEGLLQLDLKNKNEITKITDALRLEEIKVYQVSIKNNLEDFFLTLTEN